MKKLILFMLMLVCASLHAQAIGGKSEIGNPVIDRSVAEECLLMFEAEDYRNMGVGNIAYLPSKGKKSVVYSVGAETPYVYTASLTTSVESEKPIFNKDWRGWYLQSTGSCRLQAFRQSYSGFRLHTVPVATMTVIAVVQAANSIRGSLETIAGFAMGGDNYSFTCAVGSDVDVGAGYTMYAGTAKTGEMETIIVGSETAILRWVISPSNSAGPYRIYKDGRFIRQSDTGSCCMPTNQHNVNMGLFTCYNGGTNRLNNLGYDATSRSKVYALAVTMDNPRGGVAVENQVTKIERYFAKKYKIPYAPDMSMFDRSRVNYILEADQFITGVSHPNTMVKSYGNDFGAGFTAYDASRVLATGSDDFGKYLTAPSDYACLQKMSNVATVPASFALILCARPTIATTTSWMGVGLYGSNSGGRFGIGSYLGTSYGWVPNCDPIPGTPQWATDTPTVVTCQFTTAGIVLRRNGSTVYSWSGSNGLPTTNGSLMSGDAGYHIRNFVHWYGCAFMEYSSIEDIKKIEYYFMKKYKVGTHVKYVPPRDNLLVEYMAENVRTVDASGTIDRWLDTSGNGYHLSCSDSSMRPKVGSNSVQFSGSQSMQSIATGTVPALSDTTPSSYTVYIVAKFDNVYGTVEGVFNRSSRLTRNISDLIFYDYTHDYAASSKVDNQWFVAVLRKGTASTSIRLNGPTGEVVDAPALDGATTKIGLRIGSDNLGHYMTGYIKYFGWYEGVCHDDATVSAVEQGLVSRYASQTITLN